MKDTIKVLETARKIVKDGKGNLSEVLQAMHIAELKGQAADIRKLTRTIEGLEDTVEDVVKSTTDTEEGKKPEDTE